MELKEVGSSYWLCLVWSFLKFLLIFHTGSSGYIVFLDCMRKTLFELFFPLVYKLCDEYIRKKLCCPKVYFEAKITNSLTVNSFRMFEGNKPENITSHRYFFLNSSFLSFNIFSGVSLDSSKFLGLFVFVRILFEVRKNPQWIPAINCLSVKKKLWYSNAV
jgi:hypothetical protein